MKVLGVGSWEPTILEELLDDKVIVSCQVLLWMTARFFVVNGLGLPT